MTSAEPRQHGIASCTPLPIEFEQSLPRAGDDLYGAIRNSAARCCGTAVSDRLERLFVWTVWAISTLVVVAYIWHYGSQIPYVDDWAMARQFGGGGGLSFEWVWSQHNEHRYPLERLVMWAVWHHCGADLRVGMLCSVIPLSATTLLLLSAARRIRGWAAYTDAVFPLLLLHLGHAENFLWFVQAFFIWPCCFYGVILATLCGTTTRYSTWQMHTVGACLCLIALQGAIGVAYVPAISLSLLLFSIDARRQGVGGRPVAVAGAAWATAGLMLVILYFQDFHLIARHGATARSIANCIKTADQFLVMSLGPVGGRTWPMSGIVVPGVLAATTTLLAFKAARSAERTRVVGMGVLLFAPLCIAAGIGWGRDNGLAGRYGIVAAPVLCSVYLAWTMYGDRRLKPIARFIQTCLFAGACSMWLYNVSLGLELGKYRGAMADAFWDDVKAGVPLSGVAGHHAPYWCWSEAAFKEGLEVLCSADVGGFGKIKADPPNRTETVDEARIVPHRAVLEDGQWRSVGPQAELRLPLGTSRRIYGVRFEYSLDAATDPAPMRVSWLRPTSDPREALKARDLTIKLHTGPRAKTQTVWIDDDITEIAIRPSDDGFRFRIHELTLLVPAK